MRMRRNTTTRKMCSMIKTTHMKLINENTRVFPVGSKVMFRLGEGPLTERRMVCSMLGLRSVAEKRAEHTNGARYRAIIQPAFERMLGTNLKGENHLHL